MAAKAPRPCLSGFDRPRIHRRRVALLGILRTGRPSAIANSRLLVVDDEEVAFSYRDYRRGGRSRVMPLAPHEFMRRFLLHLLPDGFHRIRHYGFLAKGKRGLNLAQSGFAPGWPGALRRRGAPRGRRAQGARSSRSLCRLSRLRRPDEPHRARPCSLRFPLRHVMTPSAFSILITLQRRALLSTAPRRTAPSTDAVSSLRRHCRSSHPSNTHRPAFAQRRRPIRTAKLRAQDQSACALFP
jgi:hypothetical protein